MLLGGRKVGKLKNITRDEMKEIINNLPATLNYSYECITRKQGLCCGNDVRFNLWIFRNLEYKDVN